MDPDPNTVKRTREEMREHSKRKHKRRKERGWDHLNQVLDGVTNTIQEPVRELKRTNSSQPCCGARWDDMPMSVVPTAKNARAELRIKRKREQCEGFIRILESTFDVNAPLKVVDFCCGSGNLTLPLAWKFKNWSFVGIDFKDTCVQLLNERAKIANITNLTGVLGTAADAPIHFPAAAVTSTCTSTSTSTFTSTTITTSSTNEFDIALALHACGSATDDVLVRAVKNSAAFVVSPCCAGKMGKSISDATSLGISQEDFATIASYADHATVGRTESKRAKKVIEFDRIRWSRQHGHACVLMALTPETDYPKNDVLLGLKSEAAVEALLEPWSRSCRDDNLQQQQQQQQQLQQQQQQPVNITDVSLHDTETHLHRNKRTQKNGNRNSNRNSNSNKQQQQQYSNRNAYTQTTETETETETFKTKNRNRTP